MYRQSSVFVFPTLIEGMGLVVLEAMACGLPVIVTGHGPGDLVRDGIDGFVIPIRNEDAIAQKLELLYDDAELCRQMGQNARARALQYHWDVYAQKVTRCLLALGDA
jgi:glycosyltransferase involved in cell wall biosynthesis